MRILHIRTLDQYLYQLLSILSVIEFSLVLCIESIGLYLVSEILEKGDIDTSLNDNGTYQHL